MEQIITKNDIEQLGEEARMRNRIVQLALAGDSDSIELCKEIIYNQRAETGEPARRYTMQFRPPSFAAPATWHGLGAGRSRSPCNDGQSHRLATVPAPLRSLHHFPPVDGWGAHGLPDQHRLNHLGRNGARPAPSADRYRTDEAQPDSYRAKQREINMEAAAFLILVAFIWWEARKR